MRKGLRLPSEGCRVAMCGASPHPLQGQGRAQGRFLLPALPAWVACGCGEGDRGSDTSVRSLRGGRSHGGKTSSSNFFQDADSSRKPTAE